LAKIADFGQTKVCFNNEMNITINKLAATMGKCRKWYSDFQRMLCKLYTASSGQINESHLLPV
jgi:hypothetical protein